MLQGIPGNSHQSEEQTEGSLDIPWLESYLAEMACIRAGGWFDGRADADAFGRTGLPDPVIMTCRIVACGGKIGKLTCRLVERSRRGGDGRLLRIGPGTSAVSTARDWEFNAELLMLFERKQIGASPGMRINENVANGGFQ